MKVLQAVLKAGGVLKPLAPVVGEDAETRRGGEAEIPKRTVEVGDGQTRVRIWEPLEAQQISAREIVEKAAATLKQTDFHLPTPCLVSRLRHLGDVLTGLREEREVTTRKVLGDEADVLMPEIPKQAGVGEWLEVMIRLVECETSNLRAVNQTL